MENAQTPNIKRNLPRDVFLHLLAIVALYGSAVSFIALLWQYINYFFPDILSRDYGYADVSTPIRFAISSLLVVFPVFMAASWFLNRIYAKEARVRDSKVRKWLIYLTLFIVALVIIGDLIFVINTLLGGEIKARFMLKALSVLLVAAAIFGYYLDDVRRSAASKSAKYFAWLSGAAVVVVAVTSAFFIVGLPNKARMVQLDLQKVNDLQVIQSQIVGYWQKKEVLPKNLADLNDPISGYAAPVDSQTGQPYEYNIKDSDNLVFELCAIFNAESVKQSGIKPMSAYSYPVYEDRYSQNWEHSAGRICFERKIDQQLYSPPDKIK